VSNDAATAVRNAATTVRNAEQRRNLSFQEVWEIFKDSMVKHVTFEVLSNAIGLR
jgi:hypothetical protein